MILGSFTYQTFYVVFQNNESSGWDSSVPWRVGQRKMSAVLAADIEDNGDDWI